MNIIRHLFFAAVVCLGFCWFATSHQEHYETKVEEEYWEIKTKNSDHRSDQEYWRDAKALVRDYDGR